ncbi:MAG TPA: MarR family transcriptional regulator [Actinomycetota bacterium]|nr:MarR family transcriptional regulator [Actinomycetota bacterium]
MTAARSKQALAEEVWRRMARFTIDHVQRGEHFRLLQEQGLTPGHLKALGFLDDDEPRPMGAIAEGLSIDASQVTWLVDRLEEHGFVERRTLPSDRRVKTVALTPKGVAFRRELLEHLSQPPAALTALDAATLGSLLHELEKLPEPEGSLWNEFRAPRP